MIPGFTIFINSKKATSVPFSLIAHSSAIDTTTGVDTTGATLIVLATTYNSATPSDNKGNTFTALTEQNATNVNGRLWYCVNPTVGSGHTFSCGLSFGWIGMQAWNNNDLSSPFDQQSGAAQNTVTSQQGGSVTPSQNQELIVSMVGNGNTTSGYGIDSSFTITDSNSAITSVSYGGAMGYKIQTSAGAENPTWSWTGSANTVVCNATFKHA